VHGCFGLVNVKVIGGAVEETKVDDVMLNVVFDIFV